MKTRIVHATGLIEQGADGAIPTEFRLLKAGVNTYGDGDKILFDDHAATETMRRYTARGIELMADYEHQSLVRPPMMAPASAKKWLPEVRGGDLMATNVAWTDKAKSMLAAGEYRYYSIACRVDAKSGRCVELINFALTNVPAANDIAPLVAASRTFQENDMKTVIVALGLRADAEEQDAVARAGRLVELERDILELTKAKSLPEAMGLLQGSVEAREKVVALNAKIAEMESEKANAAFDAIFKQAEVDMKIPPAADHGRRKYALGLRGKQDAAVQLKSYVDSIEPLVAKKNEVVEVTPTDAETLTAAEIEVAKKFVGDDPEALEKRLAGLRDMKAQDKKRSAAR